ncbi:glycoside hydrolase N-terminal domain-containing protein [Lederbergia citrea]|uniref:Glycoside hydrolase N-terminal domain-containing protein n=1 Tax=Lederbergia citrea TaxID=2833581 RepID=A0A942UNT0_9BACI|nr:glycoside hydrolase N-terminal domain-containing protein [Lederbergia citrea]
MQYTCNEVEYNREIFASYPNGVMVIRVTASKKQSVLFHVYFDRGQTRNLDEMEAVSSDCLVMRGKTGGENGISFRSWNSESGIWRAYCITA